MTWFDEQPGTLDAVLSVLLGISHDQWAWLGIVAALLVASTLSRRAARARARRLAEADAGQAIPEIRRAALAAGFEAYAIQWTQRGTAVVLTLWGSRGSVTAVGRGRHRSVAALAALAAILAALPPEPMPQADAPRSGTGGYSEAGNGRDRGGPTHDPAPAPDWWRDALGLAPGATRADADRAWRSLAKTAHPDLGGSAERMARLNAARDEARRVLGQGGLTSGSV